MSNKKLAISLNVLEVVIQTLVFLSFIIALMMGTLGLNAGQLWKCLIVVIPVCIMYVLRKIVNKFQVFVVLDCLVVLSSFLLGSNYDEKVFYVIIFCLIGLYSVRVKYKMIKYKQTAMQLGEKAVLQDVDIKGRLREHYFDGEKVPMAFAGLMVFGYFLGFSKGNPVVLNCEVIICTLFVLCKIVYNHLDKLNDVYVSNADKSEFPAQQLKNVNIFTLVITCILVFLGMLAFYNGEYGNIFSIIGDVGMSGIRAILKGFIFILGLFGGNENEAIEETTQAVTESSDGLDFEEVIQPSHFAEALAETFGIMLMLAAVFALIYFGVRYLKQLNKTKRLGTDMVEYIKPDNRKVSIQNNVYKDVTETGEENNKKAVRKYYKKRVKKGFGKEKPQKTYMPIELTKHSITNDEAQSKKITDIYEKARYSNEPITKEELDIIKSK